MKKYIEKDHVRIVYCIKNHEQEHILIKQTIET